MKFEIKGPFRENIYTLMRRAGYPAVLLSKRKGRQKNELEFARPVRGYPRFHLFVKLQNNTLIFKLHLDQKKPIYKGTPAHAGEYDGDLVVKEAERIKEMFK
ncbi:MAG TPA: hypothetical protein VMV66_03005 [Candidatus Humimicrobiaceae bacterium]|nr:hypothetical protein [Candidatus Humimicrobiaceae bacterium]